MRLRIEESRRRSRLRCGATTVLGLTILIAAAQATGVETGSEDHCVSCHDSDQLPIALGHSVGEWRVSPHAGAAVGCEKCHGGDPSSALADVAHRGVLPASDPKSLVHPRNLATTCGTCHAKERAAYAATVHGAQVEETDQQVCVAADCFDHVMMIAESSRAEPNAFQLKYYAPGVGNIKIGYRGDDATRAQLELVEIRVLSPEEMAEVREMALKLEENAYQISKEVYDQTEPAE